MTLIAAIEENGTPILIGDVLISSERPFYYEHNSIPTRDDLELIIPRGNQFHIDKPFQKTYIVSRTFAVGFSGYIDCAQDIINTLLLFFSNREPTIVEVRQHFTRITDRKPQPCTIIGWVIDNGDKYCFRWKSNEPKKFDLDSQFIEGSGKNHFQNLYNNRGLSISDNPIEMVLCIIGNLLKDEVLYGENLRYRFGGGYKIIFFDGEKFVTVPSVTYIFLRLDEVIKNKEINLIEMNRILKFFQNDEVMEILVTYIDEDNISSQEEIEPELPKLQMHYTFPVSVQPGDQFILNSNLSLKSKYYCVCGDLRLTDRFPSPFSDKYPIISPAFTVSEGKRDKYLEIKDQPDDIEQFSLENGYFQRIFNLLKTIDRDQILSDMLDSIS